MWKDQVNSGRQSPRGLECLGCDPLLRYHSATLRGWYQPPPLGLPTSANAQSVAPWPPTSPHSVQWLEIKARNRPDSPAHKRTSAGRRHGR